MRVIQISQSIKQEIAERVIEQAHPGYSADHMGQWYVVNGTSVQHKQRKAPWAPWSDNSDVISVDDLVFIYGGAKAENADFTPEADDSDTDREINIEFALGYVPDSYDADDYEARNDG